MADKPKGICKFDECENEIWHDVLGICYTCYSGLRYWRDRSIADKRYRLSRLKRLVDRMEHMAGGDIPKRHLPPIRTRAEIAAAKQGSNVVPLHKRQPPKKAERHGTQESKK